MKVTLHTPQVLVEVVEVPDDYAGQPDDTVIARARRSRGANRISAETFDDGETFIVDRGSSDLEAIAERLRATKAANDAALATAARFAVDEIGAGRASERSIAERFGVDRNTVRAWLGKPRSR